MTATTRHTEPLSAYVQRVWVVHDRYAEACKALTVMGIEELEREVECPRTRNEGEQRE